MITQEMKICTKCGEEKILENFPLASKPRNNGIQSRRAECKACYSMRSSAWSKANPEKANASALAWKRRNRKQHNINVRKWNKANRFKLSLTRSHQVAKRLDHLPCSATPLELSNAFTGQCAICKISETECKIRLHMDHDHKTGKFRGWLCHNCNKGLGLFVDSAKTLRLAINYLNGVSE